MILCGSLERGAVVLWFPIIPCHFASRYFPCDMEEVLIDLVDGKARYTFLVLSVLL